MVQKFFSRNNKWNLLTILIICTIIIIVIALQGKKSNEEIQHIVQEQFTQQQLLLSKQMSAGIEEFLNQKTINLEILDKHISDIPPDEMVAEFINVYYKSRGIYAIEYINESGIVTMGYPEENIPLGYDLYEQDRPYAFEKAKNDKTTFIARPVPLLEGGLGVFIWSPVYNGNEFKGVILAIIRISEISNRFLKNDDLPGDIYMIDQYGTILYDSSGKYQEGENCLSDENKTNPQLVQIFNDQMNGTVGTGYYFEGNTFDRVENDTKVQPVFIEQGYIGHSTVREIRSGRKLVAYSPIIWRNRLWSVAVISPVSEVDALVYSVYEKQGRFFGLSVGFILLFSLSIILLLARWNKSLELEVENKTGELKDSNELLQKANKKLMELDKLKSDFVSMVSHELKTPLTPMKTSAEFLLHDDPEQSVRKEMLELIIKNINRQTRMVDDLLNISRIESGRMRYYKEFVNLHNIINSAIETFKKQSEEKGLNIKIDIPENLSDLCADKDKLIQVFINLLSNALKFTQTGGNVEIKAREYEKYIEVLVKDDGIGIPRDKLDKIFDKFYQVDNTSARPYGGSGLGLAISKSIVEGLGGNIRVESTPGEGSSFILTFKK